MAQPVAHFAVGMAVPFGVAAAVWAIRPGRPHPGFVYVPALMWICGCVALAPKALVTVFPPLRNLLTIPVLGDIFFFHAVLTRAGNGGDAWGMALLVMMWTCVATGYLRYLGRVRNDSLRGHRS